MNVFGDSANPQLWKVLITAKYAKVEVNSKLGVVANAKETLEKSAVGKVPYLETKEGTIFEANAIVRYLARLSKGSLYGSNDFEAGLIEQFLVYSVHDIELPASVWTWPILGFIPNNAVATQKAKGDVRKALDYLNKHLLTRTFLVGNRITIADIVVAMELFYLYQKVLDLGFRKAYNNVNRWFLTIVNQPEVKAIVGEFTLCDKMEVAPEVEVAEEPKKEKKEEKKPKEEKPKEAKKPAKKAAEDDGEEENEFAEKEEKKSKLDLLPPSKFIMDEWKRVYSNTKDMRGDALPWFWKNLDTEGYSVWFCYYKYNDECNKLFMTANQLGGFIQRLDKVRKYGFGSLAIFGEEPKLEVAGCWLFRGTTVPEEMTVVDDYEYYEWVKCDPSKPEDVALANDFFDQSGNFGSNKVFNQGKIFK